MQMSVRILLFIVATAFTLLSALLFYAYEKNSRTLLEKINVSQMIRLDNIATNIELDIQQLREEMKFLSQLDSFNDVAIRDIDKRVLQILHNKKTSQKFALQLRVLDMKDAVIAQTSSQPFRPEKGIVLRQNIYASLQQHQALGVLELYIPYTSLALYFPKGTQHYTLKSAKNAILVASPERFHDHVHFRKFYFKDEALKGSYLQSSLSQSIMDTLLYSFWSYSAIATIIFVSALLLFALFYSYQLYKQREALQKTQLRLIEEANHATRVKARFISQMSHEFRTPLNSIIGFSQFLIQEHLVDKSYKNLPHHIEKAGKHLLSLVDNILALSKKEHHDNEDFVLTPLDIVVLTEEVVTLMQVQSQKKSLNLSMVTSLKSFEVMLDKHVYQQVLFNLVENAIKYTPEGSVVITIETKENALSVSVKDSGIGMPDTQQIFNAFIRLKNSKNIKGTGLGLALVEAYVIKLGATIEAYSEGEGMGSEFIMQFKV